MFRLYTQGMEVSSLALTKQFDYLYFEVFGNRLEPLPRQRRERAKFKVKEDLPKSKEEYGDLRNKRFTTTIDSLVSDAYAEVEALGEEMREAYDNTPDSLKEADIGGRRGEAADALEEIAGDTPDIPESVSQLSVLFVPANGLSSRSKRASNIVDMLTTAAGELRNYVENYEDDGKEELDFSDIEALADKLENDAGDLESVDFPGMYS